MQHPHHPRYRLEPHNPTWARDAEAEIARLSPLFGQSLVRIAHIGSTAIPGIMAKPIIDLMAEVTDLAPLDAHRPVFEALGYEWLGEHGIPERRYLRLPDNRIHLHCFEKGARPARRFLALRDYLRARPDRAKLYEAAKLPAMAKHQDGTANYREEKAPILYALETEALAWSARQII